MKKVKQRHGKTIMQSIRERYCSPNFLSRITPYRLTKDIDVPTPRVNDIVRGKRSISADSALCLAKYFGLTAEFWLNLQNLYDLRIASKSADLKKVKVKAS